MVAFLAILQLRIWVDWGSFYRITDLNKRSSHLFHWGLILTIWVFSFHYTAFFILNKTIFTKPSLRTILPVVSQWSFLLSLGNCLWKPVLSKQVIPSSFSLAWIKVFVHAYLGSLWKADQGTIFLSTSFTSKFSCCIRRKLVRYKTFCNLLLRDWKSIIII